MNPPKTVIVEDIRRILENGLVHDRDIITAYDAVHTVLADQDSKPMGKRFKDLLAKHLPQGTFKTIARFSEYTMPLPGLKDRDGTQSTFAVLLSYGNTFKLADLEKHNGCATVGAPERIARRQEWLASPVTLGKLVDLINAYNAARFAMQGWKAEHYGPGRSSFPDFWALEIQGLDDERK